LKPKRCLLLLLPLIWISFFVIPLCAEERTGTEEEGSKGGLEVKFQNDLLSVNAVNYPLRTILDEVIKHTGLKITVLGMLEEKIFVRIENLSLDKGLSKIIGNKANFVFYYAQKVSGDGVPAVQLAEVKVYPQEKAGYTVAGVVPQVNAGNMLPSAAGKAPQNSKESIRKSPESSGGGMDKGKVNEELLGALKSQDSEVRENAAYALSEIGNKKAVEPLIKSLDDENPWVRESAAHALAEIGDKKAVDPLIKSLTDENSWVRESAVRALGTLHDEQAVEPLKKLLDDEDGDVRESAADVLKQITGSDYKTKSPSE